MPMSTDSFCAHHASSCEEGGKPVVLIPWDQYQAVVNALRNKSFHGMELIGRASVIPEVTLAAHRCSARYDLRV